MCVRMHGVPACIACLRVRVCCGSVGEWMGFCMFSPTANTQTDLPLHSPKTHLHAITAPQRYLQRKTQTTEVLHFSKVDFSSLKAFPPRGKKTRFD